MLFGVTGWARQGQKQEQVMGKEKQENIVKDLKQKKKAPVARASDRMIKKELEVEKLDVKRARGRTWVGRL
jgi:hypothetical protein